MERDTQRNIKMIDNKGKIEVNLKNYMARILSYIRNEFYMV